VRLRTILKPSGRAIFKEPVRDSRLLRTVRRLIPYRAPDVSPFERPLTLGELRRFSAKFRSCTIRSFSLPFVNLVEAFPALRRYGASAYRPDDAILKKIPSLTPLSGCRVFELTK
jgi:hypothetical protein